MTRVTNTITLYDSSPMYVTSSKILFYSGLFVFEIWWNDTTIQNENIYPRNVIEYSRRSTLVFQYFNSMYFVHICSKFSFPFSSSFFFFFLVTIQKYTFSIKEKNKKINNKHESIVRYKLKIIENISFFFVTSYNSTIRRKRLEKLEI